MVANNATARMGGKVSESGDKSEDLPHIQGFTLESVERQIQAPGIGRV